MGYRIAVADVTLSHRYDGPMRGSPWTVKWP